MSVTQTKEEPVIRFDTTRFGPLSVAEEKVITFSRGIPGFANLRRFILIDHDAQGLFKWLQSVDEPSLAFLLTNPNAFRADYTVPLKRAEIEELGVKDASDVITLVMVCVSQGENKRVSLNLKGPVVFNSGNMRAVQCIVDRDDYPSDYEIKV
ncbi:MAG: flagellar assembly protein FliW [Thermodesulfobacteriota bacterium]